MFEIWIAKIILCIYWSSFTFKHKHLSVLSGLCIDLHKLAFQCLSSYPVNQHSLQVSDHCCFPFALCVSSLIKHDVLYWRISTCSVVSAALSSAMGHRNACWTRFRSSLFIILIPITHLILFLYLMYTDNIANVTLWPWKIIVILMLLHFLLIIYKPQLKIQTSCWKQTQILSILEIWLNLESLSRLYTAIWDVESRDVSWKSI